MSRGLPRFSVQVSPHMHEQLHALATSDDTTISELLRRAVDGWDDTRLIGMDRKARALSVRLGEKRRRKIARLAKRLKISQAKCMVMMLEPLLETMPAAKAGKAPKAAPPGAKARKTPKAAPPTASARGQSRSKIQGNNRDQRQSQVQGKKKASSPPARKPSMARQPPATRATPARPATSSGKTRAAAARAAPAPRAAARTSRKR